MADPVDPVDPADPADPADLADPSPSRTGTRATIGLLVTAFVAATFGLIGPSVFRLPEPPLRIVHGDWIGYQPLSIAHGRGYLDVDLARVRQLPSSSAAMAAILTGSADAVAVTLDEALRLLYQREDLRIVLVMDISDGGDAIVARPGISSMADLRGRRIGVEGTALGAYLLSRALEFHGLRIDEVSTVALIPDEYESAFTAGRVDALVTYEPMRTRLVRAGAVVVFDSSEIPNAILDVLVMGAETLRSRPQDVRRVLAAWFRATGEIATAPDITLPMLSRVTGLDEADLPPALSRLRFPSSREVRDMLGGRSPTLLPVASHTARLMHEAGLLDRVTPLVRLLPSDVEEIYEGLP